MLNVRNEFSVSASHTRGGFNLPKISCTVSDEITESEEVLILQTVSESIKSAFADARRQCRHQKVLDESLREIKGVEPEAAND